MVLGDDKATLLVNLGFKIVYQDEMVIGIKDLSEKFRESMTKNAVGVY